MGVQASITIAILKAYAELNLPNKTPIFIDEPELFLHPQAQRNFYKILREMAEDRKDDRGNIIKGLQIFYTTHSPSFLRTDKFNEIFIVKKNKECGTYINSAKIDNFVKDFKNRTNRDSTTEEIFLRFKNAYENTGDSQKANEAFFAKKIVLVEGQSESLVLPYFFDLVRFDYIKEGISIVRCGSKSELDRFFRLYNEFGLPCFILFDGDEQNKNGEDGQESIDKNKAILGLFNDNDNREWPDGKVQDRCLGFKTRLEDNLDFTTAKKGLELFIEVKSKILKEKQVPSWVNEMIEKISALNTPLPSVLKP